MKFVILLQGVEFVPVGLYKQVRAGECKTGGLRGSLRKMQGLFSKGFYIILSFISATQQQHRQQQQTLLLLSLLSALSPSNNFLSPNLT